MPAVLPDMDSLPLRPSELLVRQVRGALSEAARGIKVIRGLVDEAGGAAGASLEESCVEES
jgi:hypothetical protein